MKRVAAKIMAREEAFLKTIKYYQNTKRAYWINAKWVRLRFLGKTEDPKQTHRNLMRVLRLSRKLEKYGQVKIQVRWVTDYDKGGKRYRVMYLHANSNVEIKAWFGDKTKDFREKINEIKDDVLL